MIFSRVLSWYHQHGRKNLPWQNPQTPYRVWVSEVMLQQTQVKTVLPYFLRFIEAFPSVEALAKATPDQVLHYWTGLGYYSRAKNLRNSANIIVEKFAKKIPNSFSDLLSLPGIGRSTAGAILAAAFNQKGIILDGNVKRVLVRHEAIPEALNLNSTTKKLWQIAEKYTPNNHYGDYNQAMMDLGSMICTRTQPKCHTCPLIDSCKAYQFASPLDFPVKTPSKQKPVKKGFLLVIQCKISKRVLLHKRPPSGIWPSLWCFPEYQDSLEFLSAWCQENYNLAIDETNLLPKFRHTFTHFHYDITPVCLKVTDILSFFSDQTQVMWYDLKNPEQVGLARPCEKLLQNLHP